MTSLRQRMLEDLRIRNYAPTTVECYIRSVAEFAKHFNKPPDELGPEEIRKWQLFLLNEKRVKLSTYIQAVCGLRFFYRNTLNRKIEIDRIPLPRYEKKLPVILSKAEVKALLEAPKNLGHRAILTTLYGAGLRVSEVTKLKVSDLDRERRVIWVRGAAKATRTGKSCWPTRSANCWPPTGGGSGPPTGSSQARNRTSRFPPTPFSKHAEKPRDSPVSPNRCIPIRCVTRSLLICWTMGSTCLSSKLCWVTRI